ncbi:MAG: tRNA (adenosine(37)-N6)-dimethylallyltransferase MiaA [Candidatus Yanofskybacteria bacterium]|nr:tRNA (adenosine(37)-N6)-dimethylallyltransferase MiaA [Candidatus Yanofskybacteria bacterium]
MQKSNPPAGEPKLVVILGPTASGKTSLSLKLAKKFNGEIVSADSRAIYKGLNIGSAKPTKKEMAGIPHHLIDVVPPNKTLTLAQYKKLALAQIRYIASHERVPFLVGGTALYIYSVIDNWLIPEVSPNKKLRAKLEKLSAEKLYEKLVKKDPEAKKFVDPKNKRRIVRALEVIAATGKPFSQQREKGPKLFDVLILGIKKSPKETKKIIVKRTRQMLKAGLVAEVKNLLKKGYSPKSPALSGIHYKEIIEYLNKKISLPEAVSLINKNDEQLVRRQMQWFKKDSRIRWIKSQKEAEKLVKTFLK